MKTGYRWYVQCVCYQYEPIEHTFSTLEEVTSHMNDYLTDAPFPLSACGIDKAVDDDGDIELIERIKVPTTIYGEE